MLSIKLKPQSSRPLHRLESIIGVIDIMDCALIEDIQNPKPFKSFQTWPIDIIKLVIVSNWTSIDCHSNGFYWNHYDVESRFHLIDDIQVHTFINIKVMCIYEQQCCIQGVVSIQFFKIASIKFFIHFVDIGTPQIETVCRIYRQAFVYFLVMRPKVVCYRLKPIF